MKSPALHRHLSRLVATLLVAFPAFSAAHGAPPSKNRTYTVQPGDSIWSIAEEFYGHGNKYRIIYEHNKFIGPPPHILKPGQVLSLPPGQVSPEAQVEWTRREVKAKPPKSLDWLKANNKMNLWKLYQVSTGGDSAVHIVFEDASDLRMGEDALLVIYSGSSKTAKRREQQKTQVLLKEGTVRGGLAALDGPRPAEQAPMVIETPVGVVELLSALAQVQAEATAAMVSVYDGEAAVKAQGETVQVKKGQGTVVPRGKKPEPPTPLPPAPAWAEGAQEGGLALVPEGGRATVKARWSPVAEAKTFRVELAHDEAFKQVVANVEVPAETLELSLDNIPEGRYFARVSARDRRRLESAPSTALLVDVVAVSSSRRMAPGADGTWEVVALTRLGLGAAGQGLEWALDDGPFVAGTEAQRVMRPGVARVRARRAGGAREAELSFRMLPVKATYTVDGEDMKRPVIAVDGAPLTIGLTLKDPRGLPAPLPEIALVAEPGGPLVLREVGPGAYTAELPAPSDPELSHIDLSARWLDGSVGGLRVHVDASQWKTPYTYRWREGLPAPHWDGRLGATPMPSVAPISRVGVATRVDVQDGEGHVGVALTGEVSIADVVGIDAALTLFRPPLSRDRAQENEVGDLVVGLRWLAVDELRLTLAPSLRARVPLTTDEAGTRTLGIEPGVLLRYRVSEALWLDTRQAALIAEDLEGGAGRVGWVSDYAALSRVARHWWLAGQASLDVPLSGKGPVGVGLGFGGYYTEARFRVGLHLGVGLTEGAWARSGDLTLGLSFDVGLGTP